MLRAIGLSLALLIGIGVLIPLTTNYTEASQASQKRNKKKKHYKKYSKKWWQAYRLRQSRDKDHVSLRRTLRLRQIRLARAKEIEEIRQKGGKYFEVTNWDGEKWVTKNVWMEIDPSTLPEVSPEYTVETAKMPARDTKSNRKNAEVSNSLPRTRVDVDNNSISTSAAIAVVGPAIGTESSVRHGKNVGGVSTSSLRRTVIDKMIKEEGWVINDYQKEIGGKTVYVVVAQSPGAGNSVQARLFYFTEVDGKIYSVATNAPVDKSMRLEQESERVVDSLQRRDATQQASTR